MKWTKLFIYSAGAILLAAALERFLMAAGHAQVLSLPEPVMGIPLRDAVLLVGGLEFAVALICLFGRRTSLQIGWLAWLATDYAVYRIGLVTMHCHPQATCIGTLTTPLHLAWGFWGHITASLPAYLLLGSYAGVIWLWATGRAGRADLPVSREAGFLKTSCPACGVHIRFDDRNLGRKIACPQCRASITLRRPENLKMTCFFCHEHIEFPAHALGQKLKCPHCGQDITLKEPA